MSKDRRALHPSHKTPNVTAPSGAVDAHCHVFRPAALFPFSPSRKFTPVGAPKEHLFTLRGHLRFQRNDIVQATCRGIDNAAMVDALKASGGMERGGAVVSPDVSDAELAELHKAGVRGVRFNFLERLVDDTPREAYRAIAERVQPLGWHSVVDFEAPDLADLAPFLATLPGIVVVDHMGRPEINEGVESPLFKEFLAFLEEHPNVWVKLSRPERLMDAGPPHDDVVPFARTLVERFPMRVLCGTNWPHPNMVSHMPDEGVLVDVIPRIAQSEALQRRRLIDNPTRLYGSEDAGA